MEACDAQGNPNPNLAKYLPTGVDQLGLAEQGQRDLAYLCEGGDAVGILYDCHNRIPLYAATVIYGAQLLGVNRGLQRRPGFLKSRQISRRFQQRDEDYKDASKRELCYSSLLGGGNYFVEKEWTKAIGNSFSNAQPCPRGLSVETSISRGHLIASQYGRNNQTKKIATFIYTNVVPQFATFNSKSWENYETKLITWGTQNCAEVKGATNVRLFIVVGAIPSTVSGPSKQRYFGNKGFSDYKDHIYPVNVPSHMWTAACCTYSVKGTLRYRSTAFWRENNPGNAPCNRENIGDLTRWLSGWIASSTGSFDLFPQTSQCNNINYHIPLP